MAASSDEERNLEVAQRRAIFLRRRKLRTANLDRLIAEMRQTPDDDEPTETGDNPT